MANPDFYYVNQFRSYPFEKFIPSILYSLIIEAVLNVNNDDYKLYPTATISNCKKTASGVQITIQLADISDINTVIDEFNLVIPQTAEYGSKIEISYNSISGYIVAGNLDVFYPESSGELENVNNELITIQRIKPKLLVTHINYMRDYCVRSVSVVNSDRQRVGFDEESQAIPDYLIPNDNGSQSKYWYAEPESIQTTLTEITLKAGLNCELQANPADNTITIIPMQDKKRGNDIDIPLGSYYVDNQFIEEQKPQLNGREMSRFSGALPTTNRIKAINNAIGPNITIVGDNLNIINNIEAHSITLEII